jgi:hypothetical protein
MRPAPKILLPFALLATVAACSSALDAPPPLPGLSLAATPAAEAALRPILRSWAEARTRAERADIEPALTAFCAQHPKDGQVPAAEALLAWIAVERGDLVQARKLARRASLLGAGSWQDFATLVDGAIRRRNRDAEGALFTLTPLISKLIDPWARYLLNEEVMAAAILAGRTDKAFEMMSVWLREAGDEDRTLVRSRVTAALDGLADAELVKIFEKRAAQQAGGPDREIDPLLAKRLAAVAIKTSDAVLSKLLVATSAAYLGDLGEPVARLAAGAAATRVDPRTVGLLLSFRTAETRRRSAEIAAGVAWGLDLPGSGARLAVRDDAGETDRLPAALADLGRAGAAVVIAGIADEDARVVAGLAEKEQIPVVLITKPADVAARGGDTFVFALRVSPEVWTPAKDGRYDAWLSEYGQSPSFWAAAGRDAAVRARDSIQDLPPAGTEDIAEVQARRRAVREALGRVLVQQPWAGTPAAPID